MEACENRVESLKKISVTVEADDDPQHPEATLKPASFDFIFGIDSQGLCDFERALAERHPGERVRYMLQSSRCQQDCRHLTPLLRVLLGDRSSVWLLVRIDRVTAAEPREVVSAMAAMSSCGQGCCGHH